MDYKKLDAIARKLERRHIEIITNSTINEESKEILAIIQAYRICSAQAELVNENSGVHLHNVIARFIEGNTNPANNKYDIKLGIDEDKGIDHLHIYDFDDRTIEKFKLKRD